MNFEYSKKIIDQLLQWGVEEFHVCAGARNIPLVEALFQIENKERLVFNHFEERSASFYAIGRVKSLKKPVAVITTSGTAVAECLPAVMEAYYSQLPLVVLTADRPKYYRGTGAPQSCEQKNIFGVYVSNCIDISATDNNAFSILEIPKNQPLHINVCFDFSLQKKMEKPESIFSFQSFLKTKKNILVLVSKIEPKYSDSVCAFLNKLNVPVYLESISNLREHSELSEIKILCADKIWNHAKSSHYLIDGILKIGGTPTHRVWRDLDEKFGHIPIFSISDNEFSGTPHAFHQKVKMESFFSDMSSRNLIAESCTKNEQKKFLQKDRLCHQHLVTLLNKYPNSEQSIVYHLSHQIPGHSRVFLGNSLPIRHWDLAATYEQKHFLVEASRGLNGIDGQLSTFFGYADEHTSNWIILGDLTALYDLSAPWIFQHRPFLSTKIVIINNGGGKIFNHVAKGESSQFVQNKHEFQFYHWAQMWNLGYTKYDCGVPSSLEVGNNQNHVLEFIPDNHQTECFANEFAALSF